MNSTDRRAEYVGLVYMEEKEEMSLRVWLPFTDGTLKQQGLDNAVATTGGTINLTNSGKLGKCATIGTAAGGITLPATTMQSFTECSVAFWIKVISWNTSYATFFQAGLGSTPWNNYIFGILRNNTNSNLCFTLTNSSGSSTNASYLSSNLDIDQWYHLAFTYKAGTVCIYKDGVLDKTYSTTYVPNFAGITHISIGRCTNNSGYQTNCNLNDFRIYDHCLSPMEVKQLSQGLVLHYPLNRNGWGQENILLNTGFQSRYTQSTGWDTTKNGTQLANSWGGYNSGVGNQATVYHAHLKEFNGKWVYEYIKTANESWLGISQSGLQSKLVAGETYTFSWEEYHVSGTNRVGTGLYYYKTGATSANFHLGIQQKGNVSITNQWQKCSYTFTAPSDADWSKSMSWYVYGHYNGNGTFYVRHIKLEEGSVATPWCPNSSDTLATTMGLNSITEYDCSGFCNNGTRTGAFSWTSDTPKYTISTTFNGSNCILSESPTAEGATLAAWVKVPSIVNGAYFIDYKSGLGFGTWSNYLIPSCNAAIKTTYSNTNFIANEWNHIVVIKRDSTTIELYINGVSQPQYSRSDSWTTGVIDKLSLAARPNGTSLTSCQLCDFRIYATALSADDVKSLYQNCAYIDSSGNVYGAVHTEV